MPDTTTQTIEETPEQKYARLYQQQTTPPAETPPAQVVPPELTSILQEMRQEISSLKETRSTPPAAPVPPSNPDEWVEKIRAGDFAGARKLLVEETERGLEGKLQAKLEQVLTNANASTQAQIEMDRYLNKVRGDNPDLLAFESYLEAPIARRVDGARAAGKIKSTSDFVREYKAAVDEEIKTLRNLSLQFRAAGKDEATTRTREVLTSSPLHPQQVTSTQTPQSQQEPPVETTEDYFARRRADEMRRRGLA